jgi:hypothetical protein
MGKLRYKIIKEVLIKFLIIYNGEKMNNRLFVLFFLFTLTSFVSAQVVKKDTKLIQRTKTSNIVQSVTATTYDFTTGSNKFFGGSAGATEIESGKWGMIAGDVNFSGIITNSDKDPINTDLNSSGYYDSDVNMSGIVTNSDKDLINANINKSSQIP